MTTFVRYLQVGPKHKIDVAANSNLTLRGEQAVDGVYLREGRTCLAKSQNKIDENAPYMVMRGEWVRLDSFPGAVIEIQQGTVNADTEWLPVGGATGLDLQSQYIETDN